MMKVCPRSSAQRLLVAALLLFACASVTTAQPINVALDRPVSADSVKAGNPPDFAVDGVIIGDRWVTENEPFPHWIEIELGNSYQLSRLKFWTGNGGSFGSAVTDYQLQYWDGWNWVDLLAVTGDANGGQADQSFPATLSGERVRLLGTAAADNFFRAYEVEVYGELHDLHTVGRSPAPAEALVRVDQPITVTFNRDIAIADAGLLRVRDPETNQPIGSFTPSAAGAILTLDPSPDPPWGADIEVVIPAGALEAATNPSIENGTLVWSFSTVPEAAQVVSVPFETTDLGADIEVEFDRPLDLLDAGKVSLFDVTSGAPVAGTAVSVSGPVLSLSHPGLVSEHIYRILLDAGAVAGTLGGTANTRFATGFYGGPVTLLDTRFDAGQEGWTANGRWEWDPGYYFADFGYMNNGSSEVTKHARSPIINLEAAKDYQINLYTGTTSNGMMAGIAAVPFGLDLSDPAWEGDPDWTEIGRWTFSGLRKASFSPPADGDYQVLVTSVDVGNQGHSSRFDNVRVNLAVPPEVIVDSPAHDSSFIEGTVIDLDFDVLPFAGNITSVTVYDPVDERTIATFSSHQPEGYFIDWSYITTPGTRDLEITAADSTGLATTLLHRVTITLADGSLPPLIHWDFDSDLEGWTGPVTRKSNSLGPGSQGLETSQQPPWFASPKVFLFAGETYRLSFDHQALKSNSGYIWGFLPFPAATLPEGETPFAQFLVDSTVWDSSGVEFTVPVDGGYHLVFWETARDDPQSEMAFDNFRLEGVFNSAPAITLTAPQPGIRSVVGGTVTFSAEASDLDGSVTEVRFMRNTRILFVDTEAPYTFDWVLPSEGDLSVHAVAFDNNNGFTATEAVTISVEANLLNLSTYLGNASDDESVRQVAYQSDNTLVVAGILDPGVLTGIFPSVTPVYLNGATSGDRGIVARFTETGDDLLSLTVVGEVAVDLSLDDADNIHVATGLDGAVKLNPAASAVLWSHSLPSTRAHRIDAGPTGTTVVIYSSQPDYDDKKLSGAQIALIDGTGTELNLLSGAGSFTTDVTIDEASQTVIAVGFTNFNTDSNPVDVPVMHGRDYANNLVWRAYDWRGNPGLAPDPAVFSDGGATFASVYPSWDPLYETTPPVIDTSNPAPPTVADLQTLGADATLNSFTDGGGQGYFDAYAEWRGDWDRWLNRPENNMADSRGARVTIGEDGFLYAGFEFDGGNTPLRYDPFSLDQQVTIVGGDQYHFMANTSTVPKVFVGRYLADTGAYQLGQWTTARLSNGGDNTLRLDRGDLFADHLGRVHIVGRASASIDRTIDHFPGGFGGGAYYLALSPDFASRELWVRFNTNGFTRGVAMAPSGRIAMGGSVEDPLFLTNAWQSSSASGTDAFLTVGDLTPYFSFQIGEHPRLFFGENDLIDLREKLTMPPFDTIFAKIEEAHGKGMFDGAYNPASIRDVALRAQIAAFLYLLTEDESYATEARNLVQQVFDNTEEPWADSATKGLSLYWAATRVACAYDWCVNSEAWDDAFNFTVSSELLKVAEVIINSGGTEQNTDIGSNWQGARGAAGGLALLATDHVFSASLLNSAYNRVTGYIDAAYDGSGHLSEGVGYFYFPVGNYVGPFGIAMKRHDASRDLKEYGSFLNGFWAAMSLPLSHTNLWEFGGVKPDWSDDNAHIGGEGSYALGFHYLADTDLLPAYKWAFDHNQGPDAPLSPQRWDNYRAGAIWTYLFYPSESIRMQPAESFAWHSLNDDRDGIGLFTFRNRFLDDTDLLSQFKARLQVVNGHDGPDGLGFRIIAGGDPLVVGGGLKNPGRSTNQATVYPVDPSAGGSVNDNTNLGTLVGSPLVTQRGDGHVVAQMTTNNVNVFNHKRWFVSNYDQASTGADAAFLIADTTATANSYWHIPTFLNNDVSIAGNTFTITGSSGVTLKGTVLYPSSGVTITTGTKERGDAFGLLNGGARDDEDPVTNPRIEENKYIQFTSADGDFLVALTVQKSGSGAHPPVVLNSGTVADADVSIGSLQITLEATGVLYDGQPYVNDDATVTFDPGANGVVSSGSTVQVIPYGGSPVEPTITANAGFLFNGWDKVFDPVLTDMTVTATYLAIEAIPSDPDRLEATGVSAVEIALTWRDNSVGETGFVLESSPDGVVWSSLATLPAETESYAHGGLAPDTLVYYRVKATGTGGDSGWSNVASATTLEPNSAPAFDNTPGLQAHEGIAYFDTVFASDPENDTLAITAVTLPDWLQLIDFGDGSADLVGTPDASETGDHLVTLAVSDGINAPVETSFTISVNARPVVSFISPTVSPVLLPSGVGLEIEAAVADETASDVSWSLVDGPGAVEFDDLTGLVNGITAAANGIYTLRATASDGVLSGSADLVVEWGAAAVQPLQTTLVDYAYGDLQTGDFRNNTDPSQTTGLDWDGDGNDDSARFYAFREDIQLSRSTWPSPNDRNFYGGVIVRLLNGTGSISTSGITSTSPNDAIELRFDTTAPILNNGTTVIFWRKEDFRNGADAGTVSLGAGSEFEVPGLFSQMTGAPRWLVRSGGQYYVSQTPLGNNLLSARLDPDEMAAEMWAAYNPVPGTYPTDFDASTAQFDMPSSAMVDVTGVGLIWDVDTFNEDRRWLKFSTFRVIATVDLPVNRGPAVDAGADAAGEPGAPLMLSGSASDEGLPEVPGTVSVQWTVRSGPGGSFDVPTAPATDYTPTGEGTHVLRLTADDGSIRTFDEVTVTAASADAFTSWINGYPSIPVDRRGPGDDWIGDGIPHIVKFAFDLDPTVNHSATPLTTPLLDGARLALIIDLSAQRADVLYEVEMANAMGGPWTVVASATGGAPMVPAPEITPQPQVQYNGSVATVSDYLLISEIPDGKRFARLKVTYPMP